MRENEIKSEHQPVDITETGNTGAEKQSESEQANPLNASEYTLPRISAGEIRNLRRTRQRSSYSFVK